MKIIEILGENWLKFEKPACKTLRVLTKNAEILKNFKKILRFFDQNIYGKLTFFILFTKYILDFCLIPLEDNTSPLDATDSIIIDVELYTYILWD